MLHFLRNIRKKLIIQNNIRKYLLYAIGEILLVVIGILIALQINNWNEEKKFRSQIENQLGSLKSTLIKEDIRLEDVKRLHSFRYHSMQKYLKLANKAPYRINQGSFVEEIPYYKIDVWDQPLPNEYNREFIDATLSWVHRYAYFNADRTVIEEMNRTGMVHYLDNKELDEAIKEYYRLVQFRFEEQTDKINIKDWNSHLKTLGYISVNPEHIKEPLELISSNDELAATLRMIVYRAHWYGKGAEVVQTALNDLILEIDNELGDK